MAEELRPGPALASLRQRLARTPPDLLDRAADIPALVCDVLVVLDGTVLDARALTRLDTSLGVDAPRVVRAGAGVACWLVLDPALHVHAGVREAVQETGDLARWALRVIERLAHGLAPVRDPRTWVHEPSGREEAARAALAAGGLLPAGESAEHAADRWLAVSTEHREAASRAMALEVRRAEELARALAEKKAKEAAAQYANY
ncbi:hypothetical protein GXB85_04225 [Cellulomonas sp. APG4]|uniref:hypothetical protein n=1 Tax=Cellulomonas sp. APG4 TaxID=1538656 RepID=UPI0013797886|nr:hypothetical protein [Cellulomonas sp. APG4]NCT90160.1 hypothetical protein [Cellulomonas sp. APG4]